MAAGLLSYACCRCLARPDPFSNRARSEPQLGGLPHRFATRDLRRQPNARVHGSTDATDRSVRSEFYLLELWTLQRSRAERRMEPRELLVAWPRPAAAPPRHRVAALPDAKLSRANTRLLRSRHEALRASL